MIGRMISHYKILEKLGEGGMGVVYKAHDTKLDRNVALKFLPSSLIRTESDKARFLQEAKAAAALNHSNVCTIYEIQDEGENPFIAMEYVEGRTLRQMVGTPHVVSLQTIIDYAIQIAEALKVAHKKGIIHRDIKSENIMVTETGQVKVMDFGLAKLRGSVKLTKSSSTAGTMAYMSPEHLQGKDVDGRTDIFSFGVVLYEMLAGQLPFKGEYDSAMMYAILNEDPEPIQKHRSDLSSELLYVLNRALEKDPEDRYQSVNDMLIDLKRFKKKSQSGQVLQEVIIPVEHDHRRLWKISIASIIFIIIISIPAYFILRPLKRPERFTSDVSNRNEWKNSIAVLPFADMSSQKDQEYFCDGMTEEVITILARNHDLKVISKTSVNRYKGPNQNLKTIGQELDVKTVLEGSIRKEGERIRITAHLINLENNATLWADSYEREIKSVFEVQEEVSREISEALKVRFIPVATDKNTMDINAYDYYLKSRHWINNYLLGKREEDFDKAVDMANQALKIDPDNATIYTALAWIYNNRYSITEDPGDRTLVLQHCIRAYQLNPDLAETNVSIAYAYFTQGLFEKAAQHMKKSLEFNSNIAEINHSIGIMLYRAGLFKKSIQYFEKAAALNPFYLFTPLVLARVRMNLGDFKDARKILVKTLELSPNDIGLLVTLTEVLICQNNLDEAENNFKRAPDGLSNHKNIQAARAFLLAAKGQKQQALSVNDLDMWDKGRLYALLDMKEEALQLLGDGSESSYLRLLNHPFYDSLRNEKRYSIILENLKDEYKQMNKIFKQL